MEENIKEDIEREKEKKRKSRKKIWIILSVLIILSGLIVAVPILRNLHNEENIFYRTRFVYKGKTTTMDWVRQQAYTVGGGGMAARREVQSFTPSGQKLFLMTVIGVGKEVEAKVIKTEPFVEMWDDGYRVLQLSSIFRPTFWYFAYYEYEGECYLQMKFAVDRNLTSYSSMFRVEDTLREEIEDLYSKWSSEGTYL